MLPLLLGATALPAATPPTSAAGVVAAPVSNASPAPKPVIAWDATLKEVQVKPGEPNVKFFFVFTNISPVDVVVTSVRPSCGCTTAQLPPLPWTNAPGATGRIDFNLSVAGKSGTLFKTVTVDSTAGMASLQLKAVIPDLGAMRDENMRKAAKDRQLVFKDDCATCHLTPGIGKKGAELYKAVCGVCHEAEHRASIVPDLRHLNHPTSYDHWKTWITAGKADSLMPAFAQSLGGPLTPEQIDSLADYLTETITANEGTNLAPKSPVPPAAH